MMRGSIAAAKNDARDIAGPDHVLGGDPTDDVLPAALPQVMAVSAMDPIGHQFAIFSNFSRSPHVLSFVSSPGAAIDVAAPGVDIATTTLGSSYDLHFGGTSAAAPHVAGLVALYISTHGRATDAAGVYRIRQAIIDAALPQSQWPCPNSFDPDVNHEGLAVASLSWAPSAPRFTHLAKVPQGVDVDFSTVAGYTHTLQAAASLGSPTLWTDIFSTNGNGASASVNDPTPALAQFYRLTTRISAPFEASFASAGNLGTLGTVAAGTHTATSRGVPGAIVGDSGNSAVRMPAKIFGGCVQIPFQPLLNPVGPFSIECWAKPAQTADISSLAASHEFVETPSGRRNGWILYQMNSTLTDGNGFNFRCYNTSGETAVTAAAANVSITINTWYHVVGVFDGTNVVLYVNGTNVATTSIPGGSSFRANTSAPMAFLARSGGDYTYVGDLDEGAFYPRALTAAEVLAHYQAGTNPAPAMPY